MEFAKAVASQLPQVTVDHELVFQFYRVCSEVHNSTLSITPKLLQYAGAASPCYQVRRPIFGNPLMGTPLPPPPRASLLPCDATFRKRLCYCPPPPTQYLGNKDESVSPVKRSSTFVKSLRDHPPCALPPHPQCVTNSNDVHVLPGEECSVRNPVIALIPQPTAHLHCRDRDVTAWAKTPKNLLLGCFLCLVCVCFYFYFHFSKFVIFFAFLLGENAGKKDSSCREKRFLEGVMVISPLLFRAASCFFLRFRALLLPPTPRRCLSFGRDTHLYGHTKKY